MADRTNYADHNADGSGISDERCETVYGPSVLANYLRAYPELNDAQREVYFQHAMDDARVCAALDELMCALSGAWSRMDA